MTCFHSDKEIRLGIDFARFQDNAKTGDLKKAIYQSITKAGQVDTNRLQDLDVSWNKILKLDWYQPAPAALTSQCFGRLGTVFT